MIGTKIKASQLIHQFEQFEDNPEYTIRVTEDMARTFLFNYSSTIINHIRYIFQVNNIGAGVWELYLQKDTKKTKLMNTCRAMIWILHDGIEIRDFIHEDKSVALKEAQEYITEIEKIERVIKYEIGWWQTVEIS